MVQIRIIGDSAEAASALRTNRPVKKGQIIGCSKNVGDQLVHDYPALFEKVNNTIEQSKEDAVAGHQENKLVSPDKNKLLKKGRGFKSKD